MAGIYGTKPPPRPAGYKDFRAPSWNRKPPKVYKPPRPFTGRTDTTSGLENDTGYTGPGVQDLINQGKIPWQGLGNLGYTNPNAGSNSGGGGGSGDEWEVDWSGFISGDWEVQEAETAMAAQMARARGDYRSDLRQAFVNLGLTDTGKLGKEYAGEIDAETIKQAAANKYSLMAQVAQAAERSRATNNATLAARGILSSGQTTKSQTDVSAGAEKDRYAGLQEFLSGALGGRRGLADMEAQLASGVAMARGAAAQRAAEWAMYNKKKKGTTTDSPFAGTWGFGEDFDYSGIPPDFTAGGWIPKNWMQGIFKPPKPPKKKIPRIGGRPSGPGSGPG